MTYKTARPIETLKGLTFTSVQSADDHTIEFTGSSDGNVYELSHRQECCEDVVIEDVCGDLSDLVGAPILDASVETSEKENESKCTHETWTFIKIHTAKGFVTIRFHGSSNGYYSEDAKLLQVFGSWEEADESEFGVSA